jgi:hypothetical protein
VFQRPPSTRFSGLSTTAWGRSSPACSPHARTMRHTPSSLRHDRRQGRRGSPRQVAAGRLPEAGHPRTHDVGRRQGRCRLRAEVAGAEDACARGTGPTEPVPGQPLAGLGVGGLGQHAVVGHELTEHPGEQAPPSGPRLGRSAGATVVSHPSRQRMSPRQPRLGGAGEAVRERAPAGCRRPAAAPRGSRPPSRRRSGHGGGSRGRCWVPAQPP